MPEIASKLPHVGTTIFSVMSALAAEHSALNLSQGFPDFPPPQRLLDDLNRHAQAGRNQYPPMSGVAELRQALAGLIHQSYQRQVCPDREITITSGATEGLFVAIHTLIKPGDEVIVFDPAYDSYEPAVQLAGGQCRHIALAAPDFRPDWQQVADCITPRTRCIIVNSPHNPSATVFSQADWLQLQQIVVDHDLFLISDEVYEHIVFDHHPRLSANRFEALAQRSFIVSSFGKTFHCTGWKTGYCVAPAALTAEFRKIHQYVTFASFAPAQFALADMLKHQPEHIAQLGAFYQQRRDRFATALAASRLKLLPSAGTYFMLADYSALSELADLEFCQWLTQHAGVAAIPLSVFYQTPPQSRIIRFCFAKQDATLDQAAEKLCRL